MGLFNYKSTNKRLNELVPLVDANLSRLWSYFDDNFKHVSKTKCSMWEIKKPLNPQTHIIVTKKQNLDEFSRLKREFEVELKIAQKELENIKPRIFLDDGRLYAYWHEKLWSKEFTYSLLLTKINGYDIYIEK